MDTKAITTERLDQWKRRLADENATPICLIGIGHSDNSGHVVVCTCEEVSDEDLRAILRYALENT